MAVDLDEALNYGDKEVRAVFRRDWDVRVLDAWALANPDDSLGPRYKGEDYPPHERWECFTGIAWEAFRTPDAARHAAALAVFPSLSDAIRAELGECP
jgi:hypothetical protein